MDKKWIYYGVFFSDKSKNAILNYAKEKLNEIGYNIPKDWKIYCDHMTIVFNDKTEKNQKIANFLEPFIGNTCSLRVISIGVSERAIALGIDFSTQNEHSHVTVAIAPEAKPVESNDIVEWFDVNDSFYITGVYKVK